MSKYTPEEMAQTLVREALETFQSMSYPADQSLMVLSELFEKSFVLVINDYRSRITREREAQAELERKLGIALAVLIRLSVSEYTLSDFQKPVRPFIQLAREALSEINADNGGDK